MDFDRMSMLPSNVVNASVRIRRPRICACWTRGVRHAMGGTHFVSGSERIVGNTSGASYEKVSGWNGGNIGRDGG
jgi:hypothetical protein